MDTYYEINAPSVICESMDDELVVINLESGCYYCLNKTAARVWNNLESGCSVPQAARQTARLHGIDHAAVLPDIAGFIELLMEERLIRSSAGKPGDLPLSTGGKPESYIKPEFQKFSDMQEMLLLDPIHDVSEAGWPHQKQK